jgi:hypothetical protein
MLINLYATPPASKPGTRQLESKLGIEGIRVADLYDSERQWQAGASYLPLGRQLGGVRVHLTDQKGFVTFCNQRDMEVLLGIGRPGTWCRWAGEDYVAPDDPKWVGLYCDEADVEDLLHENECMLREYSAATTQYGRWLMPPYVWVPPVSTELRVHIEPGYDVEEVHVLYAEYDTGYGPDERIETLHQRWSRSERRRIQWNRV